MNVTLRQLRYFDALARHGHFGRAADACAISQPAMSMRIKELEEELGAPLVERAARSIRLTGFGQEVVEKAREVLRAVDELGEFAQAAHGGMIGRLRLGVIPTIAPYLLPALIGTLSRRYPGLDIHVRETMTSTLIAELHEGRLDAAILALPISEPAFAETPLFDEEFVLVRPEADADKPVPDQDGLREMRLLLLEEGHCFRDQALSFCNLQTSAPRETLDGSSLSTLVQMVGAGIGVTLIPEMAIAVETRATPVSVARFPEPKPQRSVGLIWRKTTPLAGHLSEIAKIVTEVAGPGRH